MNRQDDLKFFRDQLLPPHLLHSSFTGKKAHEDAAVLRHTALLATRVGVTGA